MNDATSKSGWLKVAEAVELSGASDRFVRDSVKRGNIKSKTVRGHLRVWHADVQPPDLSPPPRAKAMPADGDGWLPISEAVRKFNVSDRRIRRLIESDDVRAVEVHGHLRVWHEDVNVLPPSVVRRKGKGVS